MLKPLQRAKSAEKPSMTRRHYSARPLQILPKQKSVDLSSDDLYSSMSDLEGSFDGIHRIDTKLIQRKGKLGEGTFGCVEKVAYKGSIYALKLFREVDDDKESFLRERAQLMKLQHANIVQLYGCTSSKTQVVSLLIEYMPGGSLDFVLNQSKKIKYTGVQAVNWLAQCAAGVEYLHAQNPPILHRDLKPKNLLLSADHRHLKLCDFGLSTDKTRSTMTDCVGTFVYMAPEVFKGGKYSESCDVYSLGIIIWEVLARRKPFSEHAKTHKVTIGYNVATKGIRPPLDTKYYVDVKSLEILMVNCWDQEENKRPSVETCAELLQTKLLFYAVEQADLPTLSFVIPTLPTETLNKTRDSNDNTLLLTAVQCGKLQCVKLLLKHGADVNVQRSSDGQLPLHVAASLGAIDVIRMLIHNKADVNSKDAQERTPLHSAVCMGNLHKQEKTINELIQAGADICQADRNGITPLVFAINAPVASSNQRILSENKHEFEKPSLTDSLKAIKLLLNATSAKERSRMLTIADNDGRTALHHAVLAGQPPIIEQLCASGANLEQPDANGHTPLMLSIFEEQYKCMTLLIELGADMHWFREQFRHRNDLGN